MNFGNWIAIGTLAVGQLTALIVAYINIRVKLKELEMQIEAIRETAKTNQEHFHDHENENDKRFDKYEQKLEAVHTDLHKMNIEIGKEIGEVKNILIKKNFN
jgi:iron-sulfur cluster repair protein YtfE (RIC family)